MVALSKAYEKKIKYDFLEEGICVQQKFRLRDFRGRRPDPIIKPDLTDLMTLCSDLLHS